MWQEDDPGGLDRSTLTASLQPAYWFLCPLCSRRLFVPGQTSPRVVGCFACRRSFEVSPRPPEIEYGT
jgi:hypothetical protein